jgi:hypothetical protein
VSCVILTWWLKLDILQGPRTTFALHQDVRGRRAVRQLPPPTPGLDDRPLARALNHVAISVAEDRQVLEGVPTAGRGHHKTAHMRDAVDNNVVVEAVRVPAERIRATPKGSSSGRKLWTKRW